MCDEKYNGWANRETWALMLHVNNDEGLQERAREIVADADFASDALRDWAERLLIPAEYRAEYGEPQPNGLADMAHEVGSLWRVDWRECAAALVDDESDGAA